MACSEQHRSHDGSAAYRGKPFGGLDVFKAAHVLLLSAVPAGELSLVDRSLPIVIKPVDLVVLGQCPGDDSDGVGWLRPDDVMIDAGRPRSGGNATCSIRWSAR